jgi:hypothetical protein
LHYHRQLFIIPDLGNEEEVSFADIGALRERSWTNAPAIYPGIPEGRRADACTRIRMEG